MKKQIEKLSYVRNTGARIDEVSRIIDNKNLTEDFYIANAKKITKESKTTTSIHNEIERLADYILESENLTTKKNEYNILDGKRLQEVEMFEQGLPSYSNDNEETVAEGQLTNALINKERLLKYEDTVYQLLKADYELINDGAVIQDLWFYQTLEDKEAQNLVEDCFNLIQYYLSKLNKTRSMKRIKAYRRKIKELLFGDILLLSVLIHIMNPIRKEVV
jgi:hypothetical protein